MINDISKVNVIASVFGEGRQYHKRVIVLSKGIILLFTIFLDVSNHSNLSTSLAQQNLGIRVHAERF